MNEFQITGVYTGKVAPLGKQPFLSAIVKTPTSLPVMASKEQFGEDEVHDHKHHGGPDRVVHQYAQENYLHWQKSFPQTAQRYFNGSYGENICTVGVNEHNVCIGDTWQIGECLLQVSEARYPCATLNRRYENDDYLKQLLTLTSWGWFYRVQKEGSIKNGDKGILILRPHPELTLAVTIDVMMRRLRSPEIKRQMLNCPELSLRWRTKIASI